MSILSDNGVSKVWREGVWIYKRQPKHLTNNEIWCLKEMFTLNYVPDSEQLEIELIRTKYIKPELVSNVSSFMEHYQLVLNALAHRGIRHGDLTDKNIVVSNNKPFLIDFAESRLFSDPRPDKRPEGDEYWLKNTMEKLCKL